MADAGDRRDGPCRRAAGPNLDSTQPWRYACSIRRRLQAGCHDSWRPLRSAGVALIVVAFALPVPSGALAQDGSAAAAPPTQSELPKWLSRGLPGQAHEVLAPLVGTWRVQLSFYGTLGRSPDQPPLVTDDLISRRQWLAGGRYIEDTMEGTLDGAPIWRKGWLGYSIMDDRYEWITIDPVNTTMMY
ncbi:MAG: DUF1579 domain-containing protein [Mesorhizobium sp.]|nr:MAG: DUF1579 domain-containing protein [Mesorhizobium sp.]